MNNDGGFVDEFFRLRICGISGGIGRNRALNQFVQVGLAVGIDRRAQRLNAMFLGQDVAIPHSERFIDPVGIIAVQAVAAAVHGLQGIVAVNNSHVGCTGSSIFAVVIDIPGRANAIRKNQRIVAADVEIGITVRGSRDIHIRAGPDFQIVLIKQGIADQVNTDGLQAQFEEAPGPGGRTVGAGVNGKILHVAPQSATGRTIADDLVAEYVAFHGDFKRAPAGGSHVAVKRIRGDRRRDGIDHRLHLAAQRKAQGVLKNFLLQSHFRIFQPGFSHHTGLLSINDAMGKERVLNGVAEIDRHDAGGHHDHDQREDHDRSAFI